MKTRKAGQERSLRILFFFKKDKKKGEQFCPPFDDFY